ncbi:MAG: HAMP domain-containing sensor histidine kinase [Clostridia bacterium]
MEKILRKKFIKISMSVVTVVLLTIAVVLNVISFRQIDDDATQITEILAQNDGSFDNMMPGTPFKRQLPQETQFSTRYFTIRIDENNDLLSVDTRSIQMVDTDSAIEYANQVINSSKTSGFKDNYRYQIVDKDYGKILIFIDCESQLRLFESFLISSVAIYFVALLGVFTLIVLLSKSAVAPIVQSYNKQQQFITNISHELKTPLAIIKTNTEVIECVSESSEWTESIHNQINRLSELINYLISLSKMDEGETLKLKSDFSLSDAVNETADSFIVLAKNENRELSFNIQPNLTYSGDEQSIRVLLSILLENSVKYSTENTEISISLEENRSKKIITVSNFAENLKSGNYERLFERFYRLDNSRNSNTGGFGIGLAMAKTIVKNHGGDIKATSPDGKQLVFKIEL